MSSVPRAGATSSPAAAQSSPAQRISVLDWLLAVGHAVASRLRGAPRSAMTRLHPPD